MQLYYFNMQGNSLYKMWREKKCHAATITSVKGDNCSPGKDVGDLFPLKWCFILCGLDDGSLFKKRM